MATAAATATEAQKSPTATWRTEPELATPRPRAIDGTKGGLIAARILMPVFLGGMAYGAWALLRGGTYDGLRFGMGLAVLGCLALLGFAWIAYETAYSHAVRLARDGVAVEGYVELVQTSRWMWLLGPLYLLLLVLMIVAAFHGASGGGDAGGSFPEKIRYRFRLPGGAWAKGVRRIPDGHKLAKAGARVTVLVDPVDTRRHDLWLRIEHYVRLPKDAPVA